MIHNRADEKKKEKEYETRQKLKGFFSLKNIKKANFDILIVVALLQVLVKSFLLDEIELGISSGMSFQMFIAEYEINNSCNLFVKLVHKAYLTLLVKYNIRVGLWSFEKSLKTRRRSPRHRERHKL